MRVAVAGTGYVGLVTGACLADRGHSVTCVDIDPVRVAEIRAGRIPFHEPGLDGVVGRALAAGALEVTGDLAAAVRAAEMTFLAVGTPTRDDVIDLGAVLAATEAVGAALAGGADHALVVKSTVVPGTTDGPVREALERSSGRVVGDGLGLAMNPEFLSEGSAVRDFMEPDRIVVGCGDDRTAALLEALYAPFDAPVVRVSPAEAEIVKYSSNTLLATLISFSNEIAAVCEATPGADVEKVMDVLHLDRNLSPREDGRVVRPGILAFLRAGSGYGGSCLPKDTAALRAYARGAGAPTPLLDAVEEVNRARPGAVADMIARELDGLAGRRIGLLGLAFKPGTDDVRESPAIALASSLTGRGADVVAWDPVVRAPVAGLHPSVALASGAEEALRDADAAVVATAWPELRRLDWGALAALMARPVVFDARNALADLDWPEAVRYRRVGVGAAAEPARATA